MAYIPVEKQNLASVFESAKNDLMISQADHLNRSESGELRLVMTSINFLRNLVLCSRDFAINNGVEFSNKVVEAYLVDSTKSKGGQSEFNPVGMSLNLSFCVLKLLAVKTSNMTPSGLEAIFRRTVPNFSDLIAESLRVYNYSVIKPALLLALYSETIDHLSSGEPDSLSFVRLFQGDYPPNQDHYASYVSTQINMMFKISSCADFSPSVYMGDPFYSSPEAAYKNMCQLLVRNVDIWLSGIVDEQKSKNAFSGETGMHLIQNLGRTTSQLLSDEIDLAKKYFSGGGANFPGGFKKSPFGTIEKHFTERVAIYRSLNANSFESFVRTVNYVNQNIFQELSPHLKTGQLDFDGFSGDVNSVCNLIDATTVLLKSNMHSLKEYFGYLESPDKTPEYVPIRHLKTSSDLTELNKKTIKSVVKSSRHIIDSLIKHFELPADYSSKSWFSAVITKSVLSLASKYYSKFDDPRTFDTTVKNATIKTIEGLERFFDGSPLFESVRSWSKDDQATQNIMKSQLIASITGHVVDLYKCSFVTSIFSDDMVDNYLNTFYAACDSFFTKLQGVQSAKIASMTPQGRLMVLQSVMNGFATSYTNNMAAVSSRLITGEVQRYDLYATIFGLNSAVSDKRRIMEGMADFMMDAMERVRVNYTMGFAAKKAEGPQHTIDEVLSEQAVVSRGGNVGDGVKRRAIIR